MTTWVIAVPMMVGPAKNLRRLTYIPYQMRIQTLPPSALSEKSCPKLKPVETPGKRIPATSPPTSAIPRMNWRLFIQRVNLLMHNDFLGKLAHWVLVNHLDLGFAKLESPQTHDLQPTVTWIHPQVISPLCPCPCTPSGNRLLTAKHFHLQSLARTLFFGPHTRPPYWNEISALKWHLPTPIPQTFISINFGCFSVTSDATWQTPDSCTLISNPSLSLGSCFNHFLSSAYLNSIPKQTPLTSLAELQKQLSPRQTHARTS